MHRSFRSIGLLRSSFSSKLVYQRTNFKSQYKFSTQSSTTNFSSFNKFLGASLLIGSAAFLTQQIHAESQQEEEIFKTAGARKEGLKEYTLEEIAKHNNKDNRIWVIYKNGVYDITDFIEMHPGNFPHPHQINFSKAKTKFYKLRVPVSNHSGPCTANISPLKFSKCLKNYELEILHQINKCQQFSMLMLQIQAIAALFSLFAPKSLSMLKLHLKYLCKAL